MLQAGLTNLIEIRTSGSIDHLRELGYAIPEFVSRPAQLGRQAEQFKIVNARISQGVEQGLITVEQAECIAHTCYTLAMADIDGKNFPGLEIFKYQPKQEISALVDLLSKHVRGGTPVPIFAPVCPDFDDAYRFMEKGLSNAARRFFKYSPPIFANLERFNFDYHIYMHLADADGDDRYFLERLNLSREEFMVNVNGTRKQIAKEIAQDKRLATKVELSLMLEAFDEKGVNYYACITHETEEIVNSRIPKVNRILADLFRERRGRKIENSFPRSEEIKSIACELGAYSVYGNLVGGDGLILSADTLSGTAAYNFSLSGNKPVSPVIGIRERSINTSTSLFL